MACPSRPSAFAYALKRGPPDSRVAPLHLCVRVADPVRPPSPTLAQRLRSRQPSSVPLAVKTKSTARDALAKVANADVSHKAAVAKRRARSAGDAYVTVPSVDREDHKFIPGKYFNVEYFGGDHPNAWRVIKCVSFVGTHHYRVFNMDVLGARVPTIDDINCYRRDRTRRVVEIPNPQRG